MTREMLIRLILDSAVNGTLREVNQAIDDYTKEITLAFYDEIEAIPPYLMDTSYDHFIEKLNLRK